MRRRWRPWGGDKARAAIASTPWKTTQGDFARMLRLPLPDVYSFAYTSACGTRSMIRSKGLLSHVFWSCHTDHEHAVHKTGRDSAIYFSKTIGKPQENTPCSFSPLERGLEHSLRGCGMWGQAIARCGDSPESCLEHLICVCISIRLHGRPYWGCLTLEDIVDW